MLAIGFSSLIGALITTALLWNYSGIPALLIAPFGGSFVGLIAAVLIGLRNGRVANRGVDRRRGQIRICAIS